MKGVSDALFLVSARFISLIIILVRRELMRSDEMLKHFTTEISGGHSLVSSMRNAHLNGDGEAGNPTFASS